jgi:hypothetical protein
VTTPNPPVTLPPPSAGGQTTTPVLSTLGGSAGQAANPLGTSLGPDAGAGAGGASTGGQAPATPGAAAAATAAGAQAAKTKGTRKTSKTRKMRKQGAVSARTARHQSRPHARGGATQLASNRAKTGAAAKSHAKQKTNATAKLARVKPLVLTPGGKAPTAQPTTSASGGREGAAPSAASNDRIAASTTHAREVGFNTPRGRFSISPSGIQLGGPERPIASVGGILSALLVTLAALAGVAGVIGAVALSRTVRRNRRATRRRATVAANRRTREQLYSEAKRQNLRGRSNMSRAELERALYPAEQVGER